MSYFIVFREDVPGIAKANGEYDENKLAEELNSDEFIALNTTCIYDADKNLLIVARHNGGVLPSGILHFFNSSINKENWDLAYGFIPKDAAKGMHISQNRKIYRKVIIGIKGNDKNRFQKLKEHVPSVYNAINGFKGYGYANIKVELTMGDKPKQNGMNNSLIDELSLNLLEENLADTLKISYKDDVGSNVEEVDLIKDKIKASIKLESSRAERITHKRVLESLIICYNAKILEIEN